MMRGDRGRDRGPERGRNDAGEHEDRRARPDLAVDDRLQLVDVDLLRLERGRRFLPPAVLVLLALLSSATLLGCLAQELELLLLVVLELLEVRAERRQLRAHGTRDEAL